MRGSADQVHRLVLYAFIVFIRVYRVSHALTREKRYGLPNGFQGPPSSSTTGRSPGSLVCPAKRNPAAACRAVPRATNSPSPVKIAALRVAAEQGWSDCSTGRFADVDDSSLDDFTAQLGAR